MGARGPIPNPNSRRERAKAAKQARLAAQVPAAGPILVPRVDSSVLGNPDDPVCPPWLSARQKVLFTQTVADLHAAGVPVKRVDGDAIVMRAICMSSVEDAERFAQDPDISTQDRITALRLKGQFGKDLIQWVQLTCGTPAARARIGLKAPPEKKGGPIAALAAVMAARRANGS